jgi:hypothetical protein
MPVLTNLIAIPILRQRLYLASNRKQLFGVRQPLRQCPAHVDRDVVSLHDGAIHASETNNALPERHIYTTFGT